MNFLLASMVGAILLWKIRLIPWVFPDFSDVPGDSFISSSEMKKAQVAVSQEVPCAGFPLLIKRQCTDIFTRDSVLGFT